MTGDIWTMDLQALVNEKQELSYAELFHSFKGQFQKLLSENLLWRLTGTDSFRGNLQLLEADNWVCIPLETLNVDDKSQYDYSQLSFWVLNYLVALDCCGKMPIACLEEKGLYRWKTPACSEIWDLDTLARASVDQGKLLPFQEQTAIALTALIDSLFSFDCASIVKLLYKQKCPNEGPSDGLQEQMWGGQLWDVLGKKNWGYPSPMLCSYRRGALYQDVLAEILQRFSGEEEGTASQNSLHLDDSLYLDLNERQQAALEMSAKERFFVLTGGPGTGKTYTLARIVAAYRKAHNEEVQVALCAPTGKARERMAEMAQDSGCSLFTLHKFLKRLHSFAKQPSFLQPLAYHLVIVDEASMIDFRLFHALLRALDPKTTLVLVGDSNQLPPVEGKAPFNALVQALKVRGKQIVELEKSHRVRSKSMLSFANALLKSDEKAIHESANAASNKEEDFYCTELDCFYSDLDGYIDQFKVDRGLEEAMRALNQFRVLTSHNRGKYGVEAINTYVLSKVTKDLLAKKKKGGSHSLFVPILITQNQEDLRIVNGQLAVVEIELDKIQSHWLQRMGAARDRAQSFLNGSPVFTSSYRESSIFLGQIQQWEFGFALTVHKSQGSEYEHCALVLPPGASSWGVALLYTGFTRAKKKLDLYVENKGFEAFFSGSSSYLDEERDSIEASKRAHSISKIEGLSGSLVLDLLKDRS